MPRAQHEASIANCLERPIAFFVHQREPGPNDRPISENLTSANGCQGKVMRVGVIYLGRRGPGGPISFELASRLSRMVPTFAVVSADAEHLGLWRQSGIELIEVPTFRSDSEALLSVLWKKRLRTLAHTILERKPDAVIYPMVHPWTPSLQRYLRPIPDVVTVHDVVAHPGFKHFVSSLYERIAARRASRCVVLSARFIELLQRKGVGADRIDVIPHGIFTFYRRAAPPATRPDSTASVLFFGRITAYKGLDVLLRAFKSVSSRRPDVRLDIVGFGDLSPYAGLLNEIEKVNIVNRWVGDDEVAGFFENASCVVLPYTTASQSGVVPLAASFGTPVIATNVGALPDQIQNGESGLLVNPDSVEELVSAIDTVLTQPSLARSMGKKLAEQTSESGNWDSIAAAFLESCRKALG